jgi:hypothetical protein
MAAGFALLDGLPDRNHKRIPTIQTKSLIELAFGFIARSSLEPVCLPPFDRKNPNITLSNPSTRMSI